MCGTVQRSGATSASGVLKLRADTYLQFTMPLKTGSTAWASLLLKHGTHASKSGGSQASGGVIANELVEVTFRALSAEAAHLPAAAAWGVGGTGVGARWWGPGVGVGTIFRQGRAPNA